MTRPWPKRRNWSTTWRRRRRVWSAPPSWRPRWRTSRCAGRRASWCSTRSWTTWLATCSLRLPVWRTMAPFRAITARSWSRTGRRARRKWVFRSRTVRILLMCWRIRSWFVSGIRTVCRAMTSQLRMLFWWPRDDAGRSWSIHRSRLTAGFAIRRERTRWKLSSSRIRGELTLPNTAHTFPLFLLHNFIDKLFVSYDIKNRKSDRYYLTYGIFSNLLQLQQKDTISFLFVYFLY